MTKLRIRKPLESVGWLGGAGYRVVINEAERKRRMSENPWPLFCCDVSLVDLHETSIISRTHSVGGMSLGSNDFWRKYQCPSCGRIWLDSHDHHTGSGYDCEWMPQRMFFRGEPYSETPPRDGLIRTLIQHPSPYRTEDTEYGCQVPREEGT